MSETEPPPVAEAEEEDDTPEAEAEQQFPEVVGAARLLVELRRSVKRLEAAEKEQAERVLDLMRKVDRLHGVRLADGMAVRRRWNPNRPTIEPAKLGAKLADAPDFIETKVVVDQARLRAAYPELWRELGGKMTEGVAVYEARKPRKEA